MERTRRVLEYFNRNSKFRTQPGNPENVLISWLEFSIGKQFPANIYVGWLVYWPVGRSVMIS